MLCLSIFFKFQFMYFLQLQNITFQILSVTLLIVILNYNFINQQKNYNYHKHFKTSPDKFQTKMQKGSYRITSLKKQLGLISHAARLKTISNGEKELMFAQSYQLIGNPQNKYLAKKMRNCIDNIGNRSRKMTKMSKPEDKVSKLSSFRSSTQVQQQLAVYSYRNAQSLEPSYQKAYILNEYQKIERLIARRQQQIQVFKCLSDKIKVKLSPKKAKIAGYKNLKTINQLTWYKKWNKSEVNQNSRKEMKILKKLKSYQSRRFHTAGILNENKSDKSIQL